MGTEFTDQVRDALFAQIEKQCRVAIEMGPEYCVAVSPPEWGENHQLRHRIEIVLQPVPLNDYRGWTIYGPWPATSELTKRLNDEFEAATGVGQ